MHISRITDQNRAKLIKIKIFGLHQLGTYNLVDSIGHTREMSNSVGFGFDH